MSVTIFVALGFWLAGAYVEYRMRKASSLMDRLYDNFWFGLAATAVVGYGMMIITGPAVGIAAALGQLIGVATNDITFHFFDVTLPRWQARKNAVMAVVDAQVAKVSNVHQQYKAIEAAHPAIVADVKQTATDGAKMVAGIGVGALYVLGTPAKAVRGTKRVWNGTRRVTRRSVELGATPVNRAKALTAGVVKRDKKI